jgi:hypothetical protein
MTEQESHYFFDRNNTTFNSYPLIINLIEEEISQKGPINTKFT